MLLQGQDLVNTLREHCDNAKKRIWIATPYIGRLREVERIIGGNWRNVNIDFRVLTDAESGFIREDTYNEFSSVSNGCVRSLNSLHAKIYIVDDWCLLTSANLTGTAFSYRFEVGTDTEDIGEVESYFIALWRNTDIWTLEKWHKGNESNYDSYEDNKRAFKKKFELPPYDAGKEKYDKYLAQCSIFQKFADKYKEVTGRNQQMVKDGFTLLQEVDYLFNYLEHVLKVSKNQTKPAKFTGKPEERILRYFKIMSKTYDSNGDDVIRRLHDTALVKDLTSQSKIMSLRKKDVESILDTFNCLGLGNNTHGHKTAILEFNKLNVILKNWDQLLNQGPITYEKVITCQKAIDHFGESSVSELIAWRFPDEFPIMNSCSKNGLRFFGIKI